MIKIKGSSFNAGYYDNFLEILQKYQKKANIILHDFLIELALEFEGETNQETGGKN